MKRAVTTFLLFCSLSSSSLIANSNSSNDAPNLILTQLGNDMTYGADEYFGDSRDLLYVDQVMPGSVVPVVEVTVVSTTSSSRPSPRSTPSNTGTSNISSGSGGGGSGRGSTKPPVVEPPPVVDPPDCPPGG